MEVQVEIAARDTAANDTVLDRRCILYTSAVTTPHKYVEVHTHESGPICFAQVRKPVAHELNTHERSAASFGLWQALEINHHPNSKERLDHNAKLVNLLVIQPHLNGDLRRKECDCALGVVACVRLQFQDRQRPQRAVLNALKQVASKLLCGSVVWNGQHASINWFNHLESVRYSIIEWKAIGTGCCSHLCKISNETKILMHFVGEQEIQSQVTNRSIPSFRTVEEYLTQFNEELGGVSEHANNLLQSILHRFNSPSGAKRAGSSIGAIISGLPGVGKTHLARVISKCIGVPTTFLNGVDIFQTYVGHSEAQLVKVFENVMQLAPSILVIDGIESIASSRLLSADSQNALETGVLGTLISCLEKIKSFHQLVYVIGTTSRLEDVDVSVYSNGRMDVVVRIEPPTQTERLEILRIMTKTWVIDQSDELFLQRVSETSGGFVAADLLSLCQKALQLCLNESSSLTTPSSNGDCAVLLRHFEKALATTYPSVLQTHHVSQKQLQSDTTALQIKATSKPFHDVYGMQAAIGMLKVSLLEPLEDCSRFLKFGAAPPKGILLTGPPGSGKSHLARAVAEEVQRRGLASFVAVRCTDLLTKIVGDTEKALRELFTTARNAAPCVLYFDQIESIAPLRGFDTSTEQTFDRMLSMLLVEMDGFSTSSRVSLPKNFNDEAARDAFLKQHVVILASTTNKDALDPAILRPGRFDVHIHVEFPDEQARYEISRDALTKIPLDYTEDPALASPEEVATYVAKHTSGFAAGDINALFYEAAMTSMRDRLDAPNVAMKYLKQAIIKGGDTPSSGATRGYLGRRIVAAMRGERRRATPHLGALLHERNRYKANPPDFYALGKQYPSFQQYLRNVDDEKKYASLAWDDPFAMRELTKVLLLHDFGLEWTIPIDRLCPPLPNRLNYIHWIEDLLMQNKTHVTSFQSDQTVPIHAIDVGTGASCIYALLGAKMNNWYFVATEINPESYMSALQNVERNHMQSLITVKKTETIRLLSEPLEDEPTGRQFAFTMCNPPFFDNMSEADTNPDTCCMGNANEMVFPGGEVAFIGGMITESLVLKDRIRWFTSMVGRKSSLRKLLALLREKGIRNTCTTEFYQGRTKRWGIAWTFASENMVPNITVGISLGLASCWGFSSRIEIPRVSLYQTKVLGKRKEANRRQEICFGVPQRSADGENGCSSLDEVIQRVYKYAESNPNLSFSVHNSDDDGQSDKMQDMEASGNRRFSFRLENIPIESSNHTNGMPATSFEGRIEIGQMSDEYDFEVVIGYEQGLRNEFWKTADALKSAILQTGRQWRRKNRVQHVNNST